MSLILFRSRLEALDLIIRTSDYSCEIRRAERSRYALWIKYYGTA
jgi:hypothetical protein